MQDMLPVDASLHKVDAYGPSGFTIQGVLHEHAIALLPDGATPWHAAAVTQWVEADFNALLNANSPLEVLLLGTGAQHEFVAPALKAALKARGANADSMDTGAACRTYNVLLSEGRRVGAVLLMP